MRIYSRAWPVMYEYIVAWLGWKHYFMMFENGIGYPKMKEASYPVMDDAMEVCTKVYLGWGQRIALLFGGRIIVVALVRGEVPMPKQPVSVSVAAVVAPEWMTRLVKDEWKQ